MLEFDWARARDALKGFGGSPISLCIDKTGLPFYDTLRLYGAIDLYVGVREDVTISDLGDGWKVCARARVDKLRDRDIRAFAAVRTNKSPNREAFCSKLREALLSGTRIPRAEDPEERVPTDDRSRALDPVLQSGIRDQQAGEYESMNSTASTYTARIPLSDAVIAYAGRKRTESAGDMHFLPIFEGPIDLGKIVSPLRASSVPNPFCAQVLMLLSLKTALWAEGYSERLSAVAYSKQKRQNFNYSGVIRIDSTAIGQIDDGVFCGLLHQVFRRMLNASWKNGKATPLAQHTFAVAEWLMQPLPGTLRGMITAQEFLVRAGSLPFLVVRDNVRKVFEMTYAQQHTINYDAVRQLAKTASSAIYTLGPKDEVKKRLQYWYNEIVALRNTPNMESFRHRVLTLIEKGRAESSWIEPFDPASLFSSMGTDRPSFEKFRDCFRMYLIQESAPRGKAVPEVDDDSPGDAGAETGEEDV
jgi:hypothetical protein